MRRAPLACFCVLPAFLAGCLGSDLAMVKVKGKVTLDGVPVEHGLVKFESVERDKSSAKGGIIQAGEYAAEVPAGEVIIRITAPKVVGKRKLYDTPDSPMGDVIAELIPKKYNQESILREQIQSSRDDLDFNLKSH